MADHAWVQENLDAYAMGGLSVQERSRLERHLETCSECAHAKAEIREIDQLLEGVFAPVRPDAGLEDRAIDRLRQRRRPRPTWFRFVAAAAAVFVLGGVGLVVQMIAFDGALPLPGMQAKVGKEHDGRRSYFGALNVFGYGDEELETRKKLDSAVKGEVNDKTVAKYKVQAEGYYSAGELADKMKEDAGFRFYDKDDIQTSEGKAKYKMALEELEKYTQSPPPGPKVKLRVTTPGPDATYYENGTANLDKATKDLQKDIIEAQQKLLDDGFYKNKKFSEDALAKRDDKGDSKDLEGKLAKMLEQIQPSREKSAIDIVKGGEHKEGDKKPGTSDAKAGNDGAKQGEPKPGDGPPGFPIAPTTTPPQPSSQYFPMVPPPVSPPIAKAPPGKKESGGDKGENKPNDDGGQKGTKKPGGEEQPKDPKVEPKVAPPEITGRKIIRTGEMDFEVDSFDKSVDTINKLIFDVKGGFIATVNSDKLPNGKTKGSVIVRMPPQYLDKFIFELRRELAKVGELKNQRLGSLDITKQYTDIESRLRAARAIEERLINIIKTGKGEIKDLIAAERELGIWRTKIEEMEGEIRYYNNQVSLSTLTITLAEKEIQAPTAIVVSETVTVRIEAEEVAKAHQAIMKAIVDEMKGRITRSELKQHTAGQFLSIIHAEIPPAKKDAFVKLLEKQGIVSDFQENQRQHTEGGTGKATDLKPKQADVHFEITMHNTANIRPRLSADLKVATTNVPDAYAKLLAAVAKVKGQVRDGKLNEKEKHNIHAFLDFNVPTSAKATIDELLEKIGPTLERINIQAPVSELSTESKFGYTLLLRDFASIPARESVVEILATNDVKDAYAKIQKVIAKAKGQIADARLNEQDKMNINAHLEFTVPNGDQDELEKLLDSLGTVLSRTNVQTPMNQLSTATKFGYSLTLRDFVSVPPRKATDLKIATNDVPANFAKLQEAVTKAKGQIIDARLNEQDRLNISAHIDFTVPTNDKPAIDKLLTDIGALLSRNNVQAAANVLATDKKFGYSVTLRDFATILPTHATDLKIATTDVPGNYAKLVDTVVKAKGTMSEASLNERDKMNITAVLNFTVPMSEKPAIDKLLGEVGALLSRNNVQAPVNVLTTDRKFGYSVVLRDLAAIPPRETFIIQMAATDVPATFRELQDAVNAAKGLVTVGQLAEDTRVKVEAKFDFDIPASERQAIEKALGKAGAVLSRTSSQVGVNDLATDQKVGFKLTIRSTAAIPPREKVDVKVEVKDVDDKVSELKGIVQAGNGRIIDSTVDRFENGKVQGQLTIEVPFKSQDVLLGQIKKVGSVVSQKAVRNPQVPENELTTSHIYVTLTGVQPIVPSDEGLGSYVRASLAMSFKVFSVCLMLIILGVSAILPWALVIYVVYKLYVRMTNSPSIQLAADGAPIVSPPSDKPA